MCRCGCMVLSVPDIDESFNALGDAINSAVLVAVIWEVATMIGASIMLRQAKEDAREEERQAREKELQRTVEELRREGKISDEVAVRLLSIK